MPSVTRSSENKGWFSAALFRKNAARFWPLWVGYGVLQFFVLDMHLIQGWGFRRMDIASRAETMGEWVMGCTEGAALLGAWFGLLFAMALFSYLMNSKAVGFMHSLPIRREGLFLTNFSLGLGFFLVPDLIVALIAVLAGAFWGVNLLGVTAAWLVSQIIVGMFFFSFAVCCAMFTGHILALPVFYGILNVLVAGLSVLSDGTLNALLVGYDGSGLVSSQFTRWCTPVWHLDRLLSPQRNYLDEVGRGAYMEIPGLAAGLAYAFVLCAVFTSIALWVYRARELERAGDVVTVGWMRPVFQYGLGFCVGLAGGVAVYWTFFNRTGQNWIFIGLVALWAVVGAFVGRMFLKKSLKVFVDGWKGPAILGVCMFLLLAGVRMDLFGYQRWVPDAGRVKSVSVNGVSSAPWDRGSHAYLTLDDPDDIRAFLDFHKALVSDLEVLRGNGDGYYGGRSDGDYEIYGEKYLWVSYEMANGDVVRRDWDEVPITAEALSDPNSYAYKLQAFINRPSVVKELYRVVTEEPGTSVEVAGGWLSNVRAAETAEKFGESVEYLAEAEGLHMAQVAAEDKTVAESMQLDLDAEHAKTLWAAVQKDMEAGNIGRRYLLDSKERYENCYQTDLNIQFLYTFTNRDGERDSSTWAMEIALQKSATETLRVLDGMGYTPFLVSWADAKADAKG